MHEIVVVTPCRGCQTTVINAPAPVTVITHEQLASSADRSAPELLRGVPGANCVRMSNRDWNVTSRQATSTLSNSQLVLVDGRSIYLDFLGVILWDLLPLDTMDVEQIEIVRGPASAVWGANAFTGVVNVLTRAPRTAQGSNVMLSYTSFERDAGSTIEAGGGSAYAATTSLSSAISERLAYRISGGYSASDPFPRPVGVLPLVPHPLQPATLVGGGELPADEQGDPGEFRNRGTTQPRVDLRVDQEVGNGRLTYGAGIAGTDGIIHSGIGPFNLERGTYFGHLRTSYALDRFRAAATVNLFGAKGSNLLAFNADEEPLRLGVQTRTYDLEASDSRVLGSRHLLTFGGNARRDTFSINLAAAAPDRTELGVYLQEEMFLGLGGGSRRQELRMVLGVRVDKFGNIDHPVFSPRVSVMWKPGRHHSLRLSVNRAFRAPSVINNFLDTIILTPLDLKAYLPNLPSEYLDLVAQDFLLPQRVLGNEDLREESLTSYELGYVGMLGGRTTGGVSVYVNHTGNNINFTTPPVADPRSSYTVDDPPPGWELPPFYVGELAAQGVLSRVRNQFQNLGPIRHRGVELFIEQSLGERFVGYLNYSWQPDPKPRASATPFPALEISLPPRHRVNAGVYWSSSRFTGSLSMSHATSAFWVDVFPHDFDGYSAAYTMFNAAFGVTFARQKVAVALRGTNLTNEHVQQHDFGDILKRSVSLELRLAF
jgi:outer membrane receptor protein involved in Fe transport